MRTFVWAFVAVGLSLGAWSLATPLGAAPDEPSQLVQAAAVVRGELDGPQVPLRFGPYLVGRIGTVHIPAWVGDVTDPQGVPSVPACSQTACELGLPSDATSTRTVLNATQFSNYPPLYYLLVGVPTLVATGTGALYGVRCLAVLLDSALIALGIYLLIRYIPRRTLLIGALIALGPMVLFSSSVVSSSGMESAAGFAAWCGGLCVVEVERVERTLAALTALAFVALILSRPISAANAAAVLVVLGAFAGWSRCPGLVRQRNLRQFWFAVIGAVAVAGGFLLVLGQPILAGYGEHPPLSISGSIWLTLRLVPSELRQLLGDFGWVDVPAPGWVMLVGAVAVVGILLYALAVSHSARRALPLLGLAILVMPMLFEAPKLNSVGTYWTARYWLPLAVGLPLVASAAIPVLRQSWAIAVATVLTVAQFGAFVSALHTYNGRPIEPRSSALWAPPGGVGLIIVTFAVGQLLLVGLVLLARLPGADAALAGIGTGRKARSSSSIGLEQGTGA